MPEAIGSADDAERTGEEHAWLHVHAHEPNLGPPSADPTFILCRPDGSEAHIGAGELAHLPFYQVFNCLIVSTGHGTSGPFMFGGVRLADLLAAYIAPDQHWTVADVIGADGFGNRVLAKELHASGPALLAMIIDGRPLTRAEGLVRLIVPAETDDALRQIKWVGRIHVH